MTNTGSIAAVEGAGRRRRLRPDERRARLLEAGVRVFARRGLGGGAHAEIAKEEGVAVSTTFAYFPTREELQEAVLEEVAAHYLQIGQRIHRQEKRASELIGEHLRAIADDFRESPDRTLVWLQWSTAYRSDVWQRYDRHQSDALKLVARTLERGRREGSIAADLDSSSAARMLVGAATTIAEMALLGLSQAEVDRFLDTLMRAITPLR
jgi:TetR/AcrR family hemagglutinin/protease transcriptional regulator